MSRMTIVRYGAPTRFDQASYGSQCMVKYHGDENYDLYIQTNKKEDENPKWILIGNFTPKTAQEYIEQLIDMKLH